MPLGKKEADNKDDQGYGGSNVGIGDGGLGEGRNGGGEEREVLDGDEQQVEFAHDGVHSTMICRVVYANVK